MKDMQEQIGAQAREIVEREKSTGYLEGIEYGEERERFRVITLLNNAGWSLEKILEVLGSFLPLTTINTSLCC